MNLLAGRLYDPPIAVNKLTTAAIAMTALDTINLRLSFKVPPSGIVRVRLEGSLHGATTFPQIMLGVMEGATVKGRVRPRSILGGTALATTAVDVEADFVVTGLTPGASLNWDAAYGVETPVAATGLKYGGPNDTTPNNAFGGFAFEIWDPCPIYTPEAGGMPPTVAISTRLDTLDDFVDTEVLAIKAKTDLIPAAPASTTNITAATGVVLAGVAHTGAVIPTVTTVTLVSAIATDAISANAIANTALQEISAAVWAESSRVLTSSINIAPGIADAVWDEAIAGHLGAGSTGLALNGAGAAGDPWGTALPGAYGAGTAGKILGDNIDAAISSRMATYTQPTGFLTAIFPTDPADQSLIIAATNTILADTNAILLDTAEIGAAGAGLTALGDLRIANLDTTVSSRLAGTSYAAPLDAAGTRAAVGLATANLDTQFGAVATQSLLATVAGYIDTEVAAIKAKTDNLPASPAATGAQMALTAAAVDAVLDEIVEGTTTFRELLRGFASALVGKASGLGTTTAVFRDIGDTKDRITATVDADGNRTAVTTDLA